RSYGFLLASYTVALVFLPLAAGPDAIFETVLLRLEEVGVGAACAAIAHSVFFPRSAAAMAAQRLQASTGDARAAILQTLTARAQPADTYGARAQLAQGLAELHQLR